MLVMNTIQYILKISSSPDSTTVSVSGETEVDDEEDIDDDVSLQTAGQSFAAESLTAFLSSKVIEDQKQMLNIERGNLLRQCFRMLKSKQLVLRMAPDVSFIGEDGIDAEGLTREFLTSVNTAIREGERPITLFEGEFPHLVPVHSTDLLTPKCSSMLVNFYHIALHMVVLVLLDYHLLWLPT